MPAFHSTRVSCAGCSALRSSRPLTRRVRPAGTLIVEIHDHRPPASGAYAAAKSGSGGGAGKRALEAKYGFAARQAGQAVASGSVLPDAATQAETYRVVLWPTEETLWADLRNMDAREGKGWTDEEVLEIEARILVSRHTREEEP